MVYAPRPVSRHVITPKQAIQAAGLSMDAAIWNVLCGGLVVVVRFADTCCYRGPVTWVGNVAAVTVRDHPGRYARGYRRPKPVRR